MNDKGEVVGVADAKRLLEDIPNKVKNTMGIIDDVDLLTEEGKSYIRIETEPCGFPLNYKGDCFIRSGATLQMLQGSALTHFLLKRTGAKWDAVTVDNFTYQDLDIESFDIFRREALRSKSMTEDDLACSNEELLYQKYLKAFITYDNITRVETYPFPKMAVREAIFNALVHSDWSANNPIQIRVEDDRLFVSNSCLLTEGWTAETFLSSHQSLLLNPNIANAFFRAGFIEAWGRGIEKMCTACRNYGSPEPVYITHPCDLMVRFDAAPSVMPFIEEERRKYEISRDPHLGQVTDKVTDKVMGKSRIIIEQFKTNPKTTIPELMQVLSMSDAGVRKILRLMKKDGFIRRVGPNKGGHWEVVEE